MTAAPGINVAGATVAGMQRWGPVLLFLLPFISLTVRNGVHIGLALTVIAALWLWNKGFVAVYTAHFRSVSWVLAGFAGYFVVSLLRFLWFRDSLHTLDGPFRLLLALSCIGVFACLRASIKWFWLGVCAGTIGAALIALVQFCVLHVDRADGFTHHPISFGDVAVAMGVMSVCALASWRGTRLAWLPPAALLAGIVAAVLSGSRGAWFGFLLVLVPLLKMGVRTHGRALWLGVGLTSLAIAAAILVPQTGVQRRITEGVSDITKYVAEHDPNTSLGIRLELWKASLMMIGEHPVLGVGRDAFRPTLLALAQQGRIRHSLALDYSSSHNDVLNTLATGGVVDFVFLLLMYAGPIRFFLRCARQPGGNTDGIGMAGLALVICFIGFGMTDVMFWLMIPKVFYALMVCTLIGCCLGRDAGARQAASAGQP